MARDPAKRKASLDKYNKSEKNKANQKRYRTSQPEKVRDSQLRCLYGITLQQHDEMLAAQEFRCAICGTDDPKASGTWHVDHCHTTGRVRGLLCFPCNIGLGYFQDNPTALRLAAGYIEKHRDEPTATDLPIHLDDEPQRPQCQPGASEHVYPAVHYAPPEGTPCAFHGENR